MSDISNSIRLNDYMSSTLRTINNTMEQTISIMQRLDRQIQMLSTTNTGSLSNMKASLSAIMNRVQMLEAMIASLGTGAGPGSELLAKMNAQLTDTSDQIRTLETQLTRLGTNRGSLARQIQQANNLLQTTYQQIRQISSEIKPLKDSGSITDNANLQWTIELAKEIEQLQKIQILLTSLSQVNAIADEFNKANTELNHINDSLKTQAELQQQVLTIANQSGKSYTDTADFIAHLSQTPTFQGNQDEAMRFADITNKALAISTNEPNKATAIIAQLSQTMADGVMSAETFNTMIRNGSRLLEALSKSLGVNADGLRQMAIEGKLTADVIAKAILEEGEAIDAAFAKMPHTLEQSQEIIKNTIGTWLADMAQAGGAIRQVNELFQEFADWLQSEDGSQFLNSISIGISFTILLLTSLINAAQMVLPGINEIFSGIGWTIESVISVIGLLANLILSTMPAIVAAITIAAGVFTLLYHQAMLSVAARIVHNTVTQIAAAVTALWATTVAVLRTGITLLHIALATNPIGFVITLVLAAIAAFAAWNIATEGLRKTFSNVFGFIVDTAQSAINFVISAINGLISGFNKIGGFVGKILGFEFRKIGIIEYQADFSGFKSAGENLIENATLDDLKDKLRPKTDSTEIPMYSGISPITTDIGNVDRVNKIGKIDDDVNIADEDMKMLMELAIQNRVNQINLTVHTTNSPNITQNNTISNELDIAAVANEMTTGIYDANQVTVEQDY